MAKITDLTAAQAYDKENDYFAIRQTTAAVDKTRRIQGKKITAEVEASVTNLTNTVNSISDVADDAKDTADAALLLAQQLSSQFVIEPNGWDASTNTPALSDATGSANQAYVVNVTGVRNLGSGSQTWTAGTIAYFAGGIWNPGPAMSPGVTDVNGQTGSVSLDADNVAATVTKEYVTPDQRDAADAADAPDASNPFITQSALNTAIAAISDPGIVVVNGIFTPHQFEDTAHAGSFGNGSYNLLNAWGYTNTTAGTQWPLALDHYGSIDVTTMTGDDMIWSSAAEYARGNTITQIEALPNKAYVFGKGNIRFHHYKSSPNVNRDSQQYTIDFKDCLYRNGSGTPFTTAMFYIQPDDQTDADTNCIDNRFTFQNAKFKGAGSTDIGLKPGAIRGARFRNLEFQNFQYGIDGAFLLNALFDNVNTSSCSLYGVRLDKGTWSGAGYGNSVSQATFIRCRFRTTSSTQRCIGLLACDSSAIRDCEVEGTDGEYAIYISVPASGTVLKNFTIENLRAEIGGGNKYSRAVIGYNGRDGYTVEINKIFMQAAQTNTVLLEATNNQGVTMFDIKNIRGNTGGSTWKLLNIDAGGRAVYRMRNIHLQGKPQTSDDVADNTGFPLIWVAGSNIPDALDIDFDKLYD